MSLAALRPQRRMSLRTLLEGLVAAPVFKHVMEGALRLMDVPPDDIDTWLAAQAAAEAKRSNDHAVAATPTAQDDTGDGLPDDAAATVAGATR